ncbi:O-antigen ligase family protein [Croceitalea rosinachiae]|uniref:O-antigen ligase family protein n=1 Tax=Croceitalea rosinachiae TaxID=3075596 RepID=A0ABU3A8M4_9FLAO|nr:O-antigen ligase family protein [Croceitalea sp. F388]MDT0606243.1 O-antigen ligase family protein [Croceitalea sp. F388]
MRKYFSLEKTTYYCLFLAVIFLPLKTSFSNLWVIILICISVGSLLTGKRINRVLIQRPILFLGSTVVLFLPFIIGTLYSPYLDKAMLQIGKCIFYLLLPILLLRTDISKIKTLEWATKGLVFGSGISMLYLLSINTYRFIYANLPLLKLLSYDYVGMKFIEPLGSMHPIYLGSYFLLMLTLLWRTTYNLKKGVKIGLTMLVALSLLFLNSRVIFFIGILLLIFSAFKYLSVQKSMIALGIILLFTLFGSFFLKNTYVYNKLVNGTRWELNDNVASTNTSSNITADSRMSRWLVSINLIEQRPIFGYGCGSARLLLNQEYKVRAMRTSLSNKYDSHNQYLGYSIEFGLFGLSFLLIYIGFNLYLSFRIDDFQLTAFIIIIAIICLFENYLIRNMGINFVALFGTIFLINNNKND